VAIFPERNPAMLLYDLFSPGRNLRGVPWSSIVETAARFPGIYKYQCKKGAPHDKGTVVAARIGNRVKIRVHGPIHHHTSAA
jgi:hypothetical protein